MHDAGSVSAPTSVPLEAVFASVLAEAAPVTVWDASSGTSLFSHKNNQSPLGGLVVGGEHVFAAQADKASVHTWMLGKEPIASRSFVMERLSALALSPDGHFLVGGAAAGSGRLHVWHVSTGALLRTWDGHYKPVTSIRFTPDGRHVVTGGEDALVHVWSLVDLTRIETLADRVDAVRTFREHTLAVTGLAVARDLIISVSTDRTCKVWAVDGGLVASVLLPSAPTAVTVDECARAVFVGAMDGRIFGIDLVAFNVAAALGDAESMSERWATFIGHDDRVLSMATAAGGALLVTGCAAGEIKVWDTRSRQHVRSLGSKQPGPVTSLVVATRPSGLFGKARVVEKDVRPVGNLQKFSVLAKDESATSFLEDLSIKVPEDVDVARIARETGDEDLLGYLEIEKWTRAPMPILPEMLMDLE